MTEIKYNATRGEVREFALVENLPILYNAIHRYEDGSISWTEAMQTTAMMACMQLKQANDELLKIKMETVRTLT
jgi:hypothetical protein